MPFILILAGQAGTFNMSYVNELTNEQINEVISLAAEKQVPVSITIRAGERWVNYRSRAIAADDAHLILQMPIPDGLEEPIEFHRAQQLGLSFKLKHHKHIFASRVAEVNLPGTEAGMTAISVCQPTRMQRLQRRAYERVDVPPGRIVRAAFWLGGCEAEPAGTTPETPVWSGRVTNISAGGFMVQTADRLEDAIGIGDIVGVRISFGADVETVYADAQFRHMEENGEGFTLLGMQFLGLGQSEERKNALSLIVGKVTEFQHGLQPAYSRR